MGRPILYMKRSQACWDESSEKKQQIQQKQYSELLRTKDFTKADIQLLNEFTFSRKVIIEFGEVSVCVQNKIYTYSVIRLLMFPRFDSA